MRKAPVMKVICDFCGQHIHLTISEMDRYIYEDDFVTNRLRDSGWGTVSGSDICEKCLVDINKRAPREDLFVPVSPLAQG